jgi:DNA primase large subunit
MKKSELIKIIKEEVSRVLEQKVDLTTKILATNMMDDLCPQIQTVVDRYNLPVEDLRAAERGGVGVIVHKTFSKKITGAVPLAQHCKQGAR